MGAARAGSFEQGVRGRVAKHPAGQRSTQEGSLLMCRAPCANPLGITNAPKESHMAPQQGVRKGNAHFAAFQAHMHSLMKTIQARGPLAGGAGGSGGCSQGGRGGAVRAAGGTVTLMAVQGLACHARLRHLHLIATCLRRRCMLTCPLHALHSERRLAQQQRCHASGFVRSVRTTLPLRPVHPRAHSPAHAPMPARPRSLRHLAGRPSAARARPADRRPPL